MHAICAVIDRPPTRPFMTATGLKGDRPAARSDRRAHGSNVTGSGWIRVLPVGVGCLGPLPVSAGHPEGRGDLVDTPLWLFAGMVTRPVVIQQWAGIPPVAGLGYEVR